MIIKKTKEFSAKQTIINAFDKCYSKHFREIKHFHPKGKNMPNGISYQRGEYARECIDNLQSFALNESVHGIQGGMKNYRGGVIVFSTDINVLNWEKGLEKYRKKFSNLLATIKDRVLKYKKLERIINFFNKNQDDKFYAYSVGHAFRGKYKSNDGKLYDEKSVTFEINGISSGSLLKLAELVAKSFAQETVLVKDLNTNKIYHADAIHTDKTIEEALSELTAKCD